MFRGIERLIVASLVLAFASLLLAHTAIAQDSLEDLPTTFHGPDGYEPARAQAWQRALEPIVARAVPRIEAITGERFGSLPKVVPIDRTQLIQLLGDDAAERLLFGFYAPKLDVVHIPIDPQVAVTQASGLPTPLLGGMLELIVVHEMTHALQSRMRQSGSEAPPDDADIELLSREGHAQWVMYRYASMHDLGESWGYARMMQEPHGAIGWSEQMTPYGLGLRMMLAAPGDDARRAFALGGPTKAEAAKAFEAEIDASGRLAATLSEVASTAAWDTRLSGREAPSVTPFFADLPTGVWAALGHVDQVATIDLGGTVHGRAAVVRFDEPGWAQSLVDKRLEVHGEPYWIRAMGREDTLDIDGIRFGATAVEQGEFDAGSVLEVKVYQRQAGTAWWVARGAHLVVLELFRESKDTKLPPESAVEQWLSALLDEVGATPSDVVVPWPEARLGGGLRDVAPDVLRRLGLTEEWRTRNTAFGDVNDYLNTLEYPVSATPQSAWAAFAERKDEVVLVSVMEYGSTDHAGMVINAIRNTHRRLKRTASQYDANYFSRARNWRKAVKKAPADDGVTHLRAYREDTIRVFAVRRGTRILMVSTRRVGLSDAKVLKAIADSTWDEVSR